ncbi:MAG: hypothetical protein RIB98_19370 [Acidimicrobiales bacterium]
MARIDATPERDELLRVLDELSGLLRAWDEARWAEWIERDRRLIENGHPDSLGHLLAAFGGAGNLRDLTIHPVNGHDIDESRVRSVNDRLRTLRGAAFTMATQLRAETDPRF